MRMTKIKPAAGWVIILNTVWIFAIYIFIDDVKRHILSLEAPFFQVIVGHSLLLINLNIDVFFPRLAKNRVWSWISFVLLVLIFVSVIPHYFF